jgi:hypothetical protein
MDYLALLPPPVALPTGISYQTRHFQTATGAPLFFCGGRPIWNCIHQCQIHETILRRQVPVGAPPTL